MKTTRKMREQIQMLQPKRVKYRNHHRGRRKGLSVAGSSLNFGDFGLKATENAWVTSRQIEAARRAMTRYARRGGRMWIRVFPDKSVTARACLLYTSPSPRDRG